MPKTAILAKMAHFDIPTKTWVFELPTIEDVLFRLKLSQHSSGFLLNYVLIIIKLSLLTTLNILLGFFCGPKLSGRVKEVL